ncbi:uncharacterized protein [Dendropsophus ebraccatus]|uniref:uncharacterized protein n=1 Tax=Dendropsophus ebraccatus TaxID=150705 RepID=UPI0038320E4F
MGVLITESLHGWDCTQNGRFLLLFLPAPSPSDEGVNCHAAEKRELLGAIDNDCVSPDWPAASTDVTVAGQIGESSFLPSRSSPSSYKIRALESKMAASTEDMCTAAAAVLPEFPSCLPELDPACLLVPLPSDDDSWSSVISESDRSACSEPGHPAPGASSACSLSPEQDRSSGSSLAFSTGGSTSPEGDEIVSKTLLRHAKVVHRSSRSPPVG